MATRTHRRDVPRCLQPFRAWPAHRAIGHGWITKSVDMGPYFRRRGLVFVDGKPLEPLEQLRELASPQLQPAPRPANQPAPHNGLPRRTRGGPIMQEIGGSPDARFWVENSGNAIHIRLPAGTPAEHTDRNHHPRASLRTRAEGSWLSSGSRESPSSMPATVTPFRSAVWSPPPVAITGSSRITPSNGPMASASISATATGMAVSRRKPGCRTSSAATRFATAASNGIAGMGTQDTAH